MKVIPRTKRRIPKKEKEISESQKEERIIEYTIENPDDGKITRHFMNLKEMHNEIKWTKWITESMLKPLNEIVISLNYPELIRIKVRDKESVINKMDILEFKDKGYLQEANRQFFHPLGLCLAVTTDDLGNTFLSGIQDFRSDPEGVVFPYTNDEDSRKKAQMVIDESEKKKFARIKKFGWNIQPIGHVLKDNSIHPCSE